MENITITAPQEKDMMGVQQVLYKSWLATYPNEEAGITKEDIEHRFEGRFTDEVLAKRWDRMQHTPDRHILLAKDGDTVAGLIVITNHQDKNQLQAIYILPEYQGKGIGKMLWQSAQQYIDPTKPTTVECATYNTKAISFYEKLGFRDTGRRWQDDETVRMRNGNIIPQLEMELYVQYHIMEITDTNISFLQPLADEAMADGDKFIQKTIDEWKSGVNTFSKEGEKFWAIVIGGEYIACGGLNRDPYTEDKTIGRVRHVYVLKKYRGQGYSKILLRLIIDRANQYFSSLRLSTYNPIAASLYQSLGFEKVDEHKANYIIRDLNTI